MRCNTFYQLYWKCMAAQHHIIVSSSFVSLVIMLMLWATHQHYYNSSNSEIYWTYSKLNLSMDESLVKGRFQDGMLHQFTNSLTNGGMREKNFSETIFDRSHTQKRGSAVRDILRRFVLCHMTNHEIKKSEYDTNVQKKLIQSCKCFYVTVITSWTSYCISRLMLTIQKQRPAAWIKPLYVFTFKAENL